MPTGLETFGINTATSAASGLIGAGLGIATANWNDKRQLSMQEKLQAMQEAGNKRMADYSQTLNKEMWDYTNYENQTKHMEAAGLNPALLYGGGGGGGSTANGGTPGGVSAGQAPHGGGEIGMGIQQGMQMQLLAAQKSVLESQANLNNVDAAKKAGVDTELVKANTENAWQGLENARNANDIQRLQKTMMNIENFEKQASQGSRLKYIEYQAEEAKETLISATAGANIDQATVQNKINIIKAEAVGAVLKNALTNAQTDKTKSDIMVNNQQISQMANKIMLDWDKLSLEQKQLRLQEIQVNWNTDDVRNSRDAILNTLNTILGSGALKPPNVTINH